MKYLTAILAFIATFFAAFGYREKSKRLKQELDAEEAESESLNRQSEAALTQAKESQERIDEARNKHFTPDDINRLYDNNNRTSH